MLSFHRLPLEQVDWQVLDGFGDRLLMQRRGWLEYVRAVTGGEIVIAQIEQDGQTAGFFSGILFRRCGVPILGSPFRGWNTAYMGFNLHPDISRVEALLGLERFAFRQLGCLHYEVTDRYLSPRGERRPRARLPRRAQLPDRSDAQRGRAVRRHGRAPVAAPSARRRNPASRSSMPRRKVLPRSITASCWTCSPSRT